VRGARLSALALSLALVAGACAGPKPSVSFGGKAVPVDVAFGKPGPDEPGAPQGPVVLAPVPGGMGVIVVPADEATTSVPPPPHAPPTPAFCPTADPTSLASQPKTEAGRDLGGPPKPQVLAYRIRGKVDIPTLKTAYDAFIFRVVSDASTASDGTIHYSVKTLSPNVTSTATYVGTQAQVTQGGVEVPGSVALQSVKANTTTLDYTPSFNGSKAVTLLSMRPTPAKTWNDTTFDPLTQTAFKVSGTVVGKDRVDACGQFVDAWQAQISQDVDTPTQRIHADITDWFATQYGGLIVKESVSWSGTAGTAGSDRVSGNYVATVTKDPGA
jgi:hypothetical protein